MKIKLELIDLDTSTQARVSTNDDVIAEYIELIADGGELPPVTLFFDGEKAFIGDGWHTVMARLGAGKDDIEATMRTGTKRDAILYAASANIKHGLRRTHEDKRRAINILLDDEEWRVLSNVQIAEHCGVSTWLVADEFEKRQPKLHTEGEEDNEEEPWEEPGVEQEMPVPPDEMEKEEESEITIKALSKPYSDSVDELRDIKIRMVDVAHRETVGVYLRSKITRLAGSLDEAKSLIRAMTPVVLCKECKSEGCEECLQSGFMPRHVREARKQNATT